MGLDTHLHMYCQQCHLCLLQWTHSFAHTYRQAGIQVNSPSLL